VNKEDFQADIASACQYLYMFCVCKKEVWWAEITLFGHHCFIHLGADVVLMKMGDSLVQVINLYFFSERGC
jgi:hypothetical protein